MRFAQTHSRARAAVMTVCRHPHVFLVPAQYIWQQSGKYRLPKQRSGTVKGKYMAIFNAGPGTGAGPGAFNVTPDELDAEAGRLDGYEAQISAAFDQAQQQYAQAIELIQQMRTSVDQLTMEWGGSASTTFITAYEKWSTAANQAMQDNTEMLAATKQMLPAEQEMARNLRTAAENYRQAEAANLTRLT
jgi:uncharacterized protein YukE